MEHGEWGRLLAKRNLAPGEEWGVLRGINHMLVLGKLSTKVLSSKPQVHVLGSSSNICNDDTVKLFA